MAVYIVSLVCFGDWSLTANETTGSPQDGQLHKSHAPVHLGMLSDYVRGWQPWLLYLVSLVYHANKPLIADETMHPLLGWATPAACHRY